MNKLKELMTIFENEEAVRLLNYFVSYKEIISKNANETSEEPSSIHDLADEHGVIVGVLPKHEVLLIK